MSSTSRAELINRPSLLLTISQPEWTAKWWPQALMIAPSSSGMRRPAPNCRRSRAIQWPPTLHAEEQSTTKPTSIPQLCDNRDPTSHNYNPQVSLSDNWVALAGENILWLPPEHRQFTASTIKETNLALGYGDGRVSIIGFYI